MNSLKNKIVFITGASSGIGKACAEHFAEHGAKLIISARREDLLKELANELRTKFNTNCLSLKLDVKNSSEVKSSIEQLPKEWKEVDILINNAGLAKGMNKFYEDDIENWEEMIDTNIKGLLYVTHSIVNGMVKRERGHVINIGSTAGHEAYPKGHVYCATKHAVDAITKSLRIDVIDKNIKVSTVDPGAVETNFSNVRFFGDKEKAKNMYKGITPLTAVDVAEAVIFCATRSAHTNIAEIILMPTQQASSLVFHRKG